MKSHKVYLCEYIHPTAYEKLAAHAEILTEEAQLVQAEAAINRNLRMDKAWLDRCPNLKVIGVHGTGTDGVDLAEAKARGIRVVSAPGQNAASVAELIVALALNLNRRIPEFDRMIQSGATPPNGGGSMVGYELAGKVFGMIGCGNIARRAANILKNGFGMTCIGYSRSLTEDNDLGIGYCASVAEVFRKADIISIGVPLNDSTRNLVTAEVLAQAKPGAILINTARGGIVNEDALYDALANGTIRAAACDVFTQEPPTSANRLVSLPNFLATPHIAANTDEALSRVSNTTVDQVLAVLEGTDCSGVHFVV